MQGEHSYETLSAALDELVLSARDGQLDPVGNDALMAALEETVPTLKREEVHQLHEKLELAMSAVQGHRDQLAEKLGEIKHSRRALNSYDHIRTFDKEQRLYRRA